MDQYLRGIEPVVREEAVEGYGENVRPVLRREPLDQAIEKAGVGLPTYYLFGPIPVAEEVA